MIGRLIGRVVHEEPTGALVLDVGGVGYELTCPVGTKARAKKHLAQNGATELSELHVHTHLRQDALELFGFCSAEERVAFRQLMTVPNVGPRLALSVLNVLPAAELTRAIDAEDKARLSKVPGVGKKTAERLVLELRGKLPRLTSSEDKSREALPPSDSDVAARLVMALTGLGYKPQEAERAAAHLTKTGGSTDLSVLIRQALEFLAS